MKAEANCFRIPVSTRLAPLKSPARLKTCLKKIKYHFGTSIPGLLTSRYESHGLLLLEGVREKSLC
uniref:Uncharacterized protein n=1 Tax=Lepeophtheirus salmonis TaxID=72036 RepID=A0A0K2TPW0_LEPSM